MPLRPMGGKNGIELMPSNNLNSNNRLDRSTVTAPHELPIFHACQNLRLWHRRAMESHEILREVFEKKNAKEVSADLELSTSMIYKWAQPSDTIGGVEN